jgi:hypothetical protein
MISSTKAPWKDGRERSDRWKETLSKGFLPKVSDRTRWAFPTAILGFAFSIDFSGSNFYSRCMKKFLTPFLVLALASMASAQNWFKGTLDQAVAKAKSEHKLVLVDFYSYT